MQPISIYGGKALQLAGIYTARLSPSADQITTAAALAGAVVLRSITRTVLTTEDISMT